MVTGKPERRPQGVICPEGIWIQQVLVSLAERVDPNGLTKDNFYTVCAFVIDTLLKNPDFEIFTINNISGEKKPFNRDFLRSQGIIDCFQAGIVADIRQNSFHRPYEFGDLIFLNRQHFENFLADKPIVPENIENKMPDYIPPYMKFMLKAVHKLELSSDQRMMKKQLITWLDQNWPADLEGKSPKLIDAMATLLRRPEDKSGGNPKG